MPRPDPQTYESGWYLLLHAQSPNQEALGEFRDVGG